MAEKDPANSKATEAQTRGKGTGNVSSGLTNKDPAPPPGGMSAEYTTGSETGGAKDGPSTGRKDG